MITPDGFFDWMTRNPGPADRGAYMGGRPTSMECITHHSMEGWMGSYSAMTDPSRFPTAWHWSVPRTDGMVPEQHYPVFARLVHGHAANILGPGGESEGDKDQPLTDWQIECWLRIHADMEVFAGRKYTRNPIISGISARGLVEHRQMGPTACPSERYAPLWATIAGPKEQDMTPAEVQRIIDTTIAALVRDSRLVDSGQVPELVAMLVGAVPSTYTDPVDTELQRKIREAVKEQFIPHLHNADSGHPIPAG